MEYNTTFSDEEMTYLKGENRGAPKGSHLPSNIPLWARRKMLQNLEQRATRKSGTAPAKTAVTINDDREHMARRLAVANL
jgi:hypothetical protein